MKVLVLESYSMAAVARLRTAPGVVQTDKLEDAEILLIRSQTKVDKELLDKAKNLKLVVTSTSGFDHIDWRETQKRGIVAAHTPEANARSTAELAIGLMIAFERQLPQAIKNVRGNQWRQGLKRTQGLDGKLLGIVGLGRVGSRVAEIAHALGMKLQAYDPYVGEDVFARTRAERTGFIELLRTSDVVTFHVPLTKETKHFMNQPTFGEMQSDAYIVNTCRGPVVDENDLMVALDDGTIAGAAMDVIEREPPPAGHRLLTHPKLLLTPHIGAFTESAWERAGQEAVDKVFQFLKGEKLADTLPLSAPWFEKT
jgi:D-3-phosphoglycerate dehydrogenase / 2-oxoglutarate reductase